MTQTTFSGRLHVAIIMDGNGRWATERRLPRAAGHREGVEAVRRVVEAAPGAGIGTLTLYAFSSDNWKRPAREVQWLMRLFREYLRNETARCQATGTRLSVIGRRDRIAGSVRREIERAEARTADGRRLHLRIAVDYSSRDSILRAAQCVGENEELTRERFGRLIAIADHGDTRTPDVDLLIRTGGEQRLSDFLLWECAYAELLFLPVRFPDFAEADLTAALHAFKARERRFGGLVPASAAEGPPSRKIS
ncbi:MAG TPA: di-trans,poly-cis-decaprenylcistransferase [Gemmatimonadales bacterium]|nr:di-trans,poly-cis-decaprenylcistransferase [Gemmatimonadales bacterium]